MSNGSPVYCLNCGQQPAGPLSCCRDDEEFMTGHALVMEVKRLRVALNKVELAATVRPEAGPVNSVSLPCPHFESGGPCDIFDTGRCGSSPCRITRQA